MNFSIWSLYYYGIDKWLINGKSKKLDERRNTSAVTEGGQWLHKWILSKGYNKCFKGKIIKILTCEEQIWVLKTHSTELGNILWLKRNKKFSIKMNRILEDNGGWSLRTGNVKSRDWSNTY